MAEDKTQALKTELRALIHDTLAQSLFSASTMADLLADENIYADDAEKRSSLTQALSVTLRDAMAELRAIQMVLHDQDE
jgi:signal transduction histidine kinase